MDLGPFGFAIEREPDDAHLVAAADIEKLGFTTLWIAGGQLDRLERLDDLIRTTERAVVASSIIPPRCLRRAGGSRPIPTCRGGQSGPAIGRSGRSAKAPGPCRTLRVPRSARRCRTPSTPRTPNPGRDRPTQTRHRSRPTRRRRPDTRDVGIHIDGPRTARAQSRSRGRAILGARRESHDSA